MNTALPGDAAMGRITGWKNKLESLGCTCNKSVLLIFAGDNGISYENTGIYQPMQSAGIVREHLNGTSPTTRLLHEMGSREIIVDVGLAGPIDDIRVIDCNICRGSRNFLYEDGLKETEVRSALETGAKLWDVISCTDFDIILVGEIGISDTICAAAVASAFTGISPVELTGKGSGESKVIGKKVDIISRAMALRRPEPGSATDTLARFGGLEIAALTGFLSRTGEKKIPVMLDGFVTSVAALLASNIDSEIAGYLLAPSLSAQQGHGLILDRLGLDFLFDMEINYGEGLAAVMGLYISRLITCALS